MKNAPRSKRPKTTATTTAVEKVPQPHGGALNKGGTPGNNGGRPPSVVRQSFRLRLAERESVLTNIADGEAMESANVPLTAILPHVKCPKCEGELIAKDAATAMLVTVRGKVSASLNERIKALDTLGKYSDLNQPLTPASPEVLELLRRTVAMVQTDFPSVAEELLKKMDRIWNADAITPTEAA